MQIVIFVLFLIGVGMFLGLVYVGIRAIIMAVRGTRGLAKDLARAQREGAAKGREMADKLLAKKNVPPRARS